MTFNFVFYNNPNCALFFQIWNLCHYFDILSDYWNLHYYSVDFLIQSWGQRFFWSVIMLVSKVSRAGILMLRRGLSRGMITFFLVCPISLQDNKPSVCIALYIYIYETNEFCFNFKWHIRFHKNPFCIYVFWIFCLFCFLVMSVCMDAMQLFAESLFVESWLNV